MDELFKTLAVNIPAAAAVIGTVYLFLRHIEKREQQRLESDKANDERREANAKEQAVERREHDLKIQRMHSDNIRIILAKQDETFELIEKRIEGHEKASEDRYVKMGVTQELIKAVKEKQSDALKTKDAST